MLRVKASEIDYYKQELNSLNKQLEEHYHVSLIYNPQLILLTSAAATVTTVLSGLAIYNDLDIEFLQRNDRIQRGYLKMFKFIL